MKCWTTAACFYVYEGEENLRFWEVGRAVEFGLKLNELFSSRGQLPPANEEAYLNNVCEGHNPLH